MRFDRRLTLLLATALLGGGCVVFDENLYKKLDPKNAEDDGGADGDADGDDGNGGDGSADGDPSGDDAGMDGGGDGSGDGSGDGAGDGSGDGSGGEDAGPPRLVDECSPTDAYILRGDFVQFEASTASFNDDVTQTACFDYDVPGPEGWIAVKMEAGDKFHFHINPENKVGQGQAPQNPVVYMRSDCSDDRGCNPGTFLDLCGDQGDEHFTFEATSKSTWYLAVDDKNGNAGTYLITAYRPKDLCGNGMKDHNETCDDGNQMSGDGCSADCRRELNSQDLTGDEVNDDWTTANILSLITSDSGGMQAVKGAIGGACDADMYAFQVQANGKVSVQVNKQNASACTDVPVNQSPLTMQLLKGDGRTVLGDASVHVGSLSTCPTIEFDDSFAHGLEEGLYYLRVSGDETKDTFGYQLVVNSSAD